MCYPFLFKERVNKMRLSRLNIKKINLNDIDSNYSGQDILMKLGELYQFESGIYGYGNLWTKLERVVENIIIEGSNTRAAEVVAHRQSKSIANFIHNEKSLLYS